MLLSAAQRRATIRELRENMERVGATSAKAAHDLGCTEGYLRDVLALHARNLEDPWVLRGYLLDRAREQGVAPAPFTALVGDPHDYWFLDADYIGRGRIG